MTEESKKLRILMLAPSSFPVSDAESIVNIKLITALNNDGRFNIDIISKEFLKSTDYPSDRIEDFNINKQDFFPIKCRPQTSLQKLKDFASGILVSRRMWKLDHWCLKAYREACSLCRKNHYDLILTKDDSSYLVGLLLKRKFGIKLACTWNDPFPQRFYPSPYHMKEHFLTHLLEPFSVMAARKLVDVHIYPGKRIRDYMCPRLKIPVSSTRIIPHVILDRRHDETQSDRKNPDSVLRLISAGNLLRPRNPRNLLIGLEKFISQNPDKPVSLTLLGTIADEDKEFIKSKNLSDIVHILPPETYLKSLETTSSHDVAIILEADCAEGIFLPTKITDYLQSGIKTMAISPAEGVLHDMYLQNYVEYFACIKSPEEIAAAIKEAYIRKDEPYLPKDLTAFSEKTIADSYHRIITEIS